MSFLPDGFENLRTSKPYWKMSEMKEDNNKLRIVQKPIAGWIDWHENKPMRYRPDKKPSKPYREDRPIRPFWAMYVWDYAREGLYVLEVNQSTVLRALTTFAKDEDWGDFTAYDIKIGYEGTGKDKKYSVTPLPHKPMNDKIKQALKEAPVRLEALYDGGDPWEDLNPGIEALGPRTALDELKDLLEVEEVSIAELEPFIRELAKEKGQDEDVVIKCALDERLYPKFKGAYMKHLERNRAA